MVLFREESLGRVRRLVLTVAGAIGVCILLNVVIFSLGWDQDDVPGTLSPPGASIGAIWVVLFALMSVARWRLAETGTIRGDEARQRVDVLLANCALYPFYTVGLSSQILGLAGNIVTLWLAGWTLCGAMRVSRAAVLCVLPVIPWVAFATVGVVQELWVRG